MTLLQIQTLGELKESGYLLKTVKDELRENAIRLIREGRPLFDSIFGYENTVIPQLEQALLSRHNILFLGLRGQGKTRMARLMTNLLDPYIPVIKGSELNEDPLAPPITAYGKKMLERYGDELPIDWLPRSERYLEKLATPDVSIADIIGDIDIVKAMNEKLNYNDEQVIHFGMIPRANRCIFVLNELPDLQARIQVSLFNILQEHDLQIRGFKVRIPLDIAFVFTANPEDYTNRGSIITPLKDRIGSQIITHYPYSIEDSKKITRQEASLSKWQQENITINETTRDILETIVKLSRDSEYVDKRSGVSTRVGITALENLISCAERRTLITGDASTYVRISDFWGIIPSITGKLELVYEGEQEGVVIVAQNLISKAIKDQFLTLFPDPERENKTKNRHTYQTVVSWFERKSVDLSPELNNKEYQQEISRVKGLQHVVKKVMGKVSQDDMFFFMEFILHGLAECSLISKQQVGSTTSFKDIISGMFHQDEG